MITRKILMISTMIPLLAKIVPITSLTLVQRYFYILTLEGTQDNVNGTMKDIDVIIDVTEDPNSGNDGPNYIFD